MRVRLSAAVRSWHRHRATVAAAVSYAAQLRPHAPVLTDAAGPVTGAELLARAERLAVRWSAAGVVRPGRRLGLLVGNNREFVTALVAGSLLGADIVLLSTFAPPSALAEVLAEQQIDLVATDERHRRIVAEALAPDGVLVVGPDASANEHDGAEGVDGNHGKNTNDHDAAGPVSTSPASDREIPRPPRPGRLLLLSSGTGGRLKAGSRRAYGTAQALPTAFLIRQLRLRSGESMFIVPPLFHGFGLGFLILGLVCGAPVVLAERPDPAKIISLITHHHVRTLVAVPPTLARLSDTASTDLPLRTIVTGSSRLDPTCSQAVMEAFGPILFNLYGCTEAGWATLASPQDLTRAPGTIGRPVPGVRVKIINGELCVASPFRTDHRGSGLRPTGDLGHQDDHGLLFLDGRNDDLAVVGGENVNLAQVEQCLTSHPTIIEAAVDALPDLVYGSRLRARIVTRSSATIDPQEVREFLTASLPTPAIPRTFEQVSEIPRGPSGKIIR